MCEASSLLRYNNIEHKEEYEPLISSLQSEFRVKGDNFKFKKGVWRANTSTTILGYLQDHNTSQFLSEYSQYHKLNAEMGHP